MQERPPTFQEQLLEEAYNAPHPRLWIAASAGVTVMCAGESIFFTLAGNFPAAVVMAAMTAGSAGYCIHRNRRYRRIMRYFRGKYPEP